jgi:hypothetical protein
MTMEIRGGMPADLLVSAPRYARAELAAFLAGAKDGESDDFVS